MKNILLFLLCLFTLSHSKICSDEEQNVGPISMATLEGEPSSIVHGCVSVITGDYVESHTDLVIPGVEPLVIQRSYSSNPMTDRSMGNGWSMNHHSYLDVKYTPPVYLRDEPNYIFPYGRVTVKGNRTDALMTDENGSSMKFECDSEVDETTVLYTDFTALKQGVTNCARGLISGKTNWVNTKINYYDKNYHAKTGSGAHYIFDKKKKDSAQKDIHRLLAIQKPNGNQISYEYDKSNLTNISFKNKNNQIISWANIERTDSSKVCIKSPGGNLVQYSFLNTKNNGITQLSVSGSCVPHQIYTYTNEGKKSKINRRELPDDRFQIINYFAKGVNKLPAKIIDIKSSKDLRLNRVKNIQEPVGTDTTPITTCRLIYETGDCGKGSKKPLAGHTKVFDAFNHQSIYHYNDDHRLTHIDKFKGQGNYTLYSRERLFWGENYTENKTRLISRTLEDGNGHVYFNRHFEYDEEGNITKDMLCGNITGNRPQSVVVKQDGTPSKTQNEKYKKKYTYSSDGKNLMLTESDGFCTIEYTYHPNTDLLAAQYLIENGQIKKRSFFDYDCNGALVSQIEDDGQTNQKNDLQGISERKIITTVNTPTGLPKITEEKYLDLSSKQEKLLHKIVNIYDKHGNLENQSHYDSNLALAYQLNWKYDHGRVICQTNALGQETIFKYDSNGNKCYEQGPNKSHWTEYTYDHVNRLIREETVCSDSTRFAKLFTYDYLSRLTSTTDIYGNITRYQYDEFGRLAATLYPSYLDERDQTVKPRACRKYDLMGNIIEQIDACGTVTKTAYTVQGRPYRIEHSDGSIEKNEYEIRGNLVTSIDKNGSYTKHTYDYQSRLLSKSTYDIDDTLLDSINYTYNALHLISETDPLGNVTTYNYDGAGRLVETLKGQRKTVYVYDSLGRIAETQEHDDHTIIINVKVYDLLNRVIEERIEDQDRQLFSKVNYEYDLDGNQIRVLTETEHGIQISETNYNVNKEPIETIDSLGQKVVHVFDYTARDSSGQYLSKCTTTDPAGSQTITIKDALNHVVSVECKNPFGQTIQLHKNYYNAQGRKALRVETVFVPNQSPREVKTRWEYDLTGHVIKLIEAEGTPEQKHTAYRYNSLGQLETIIKPDGCLIQHSYDARGCLSEQRASDGSIHYRMTYDSKHNPLLVEDLVYQKITSRTFSRHDQVLEETLGNGLTLQYSYDNLGRLTSLKLPDQSIVAHSYNPYRLQKVERQDAQGQALYAHVYEAYDLLGGLLKASLVGQAGKLTQERDLLNRIVSIRTQQWGETIDAYDVHGNPLVKKIDCAVQGTETNQYVYDDLQQLKSEKDHEYLHDSLYNRVSKNGKEHCVNALNQLVSTECVKYEYDRCGRLIKKLIGNNSVEYAYDGLDRLISLTNENRQTRYCYDYDNRRLSKSSGIIDENNCWIEHETVHYLYQGKNEIGASDNQGRLFELRVLGFGQGAEIGAAVAIEYEGRCFAPVHDHNGSVVSLVDALTGRVEETYKYTAFGEEEIFDSSGQRKAKAFNSWRYASKRVDEESGLVFFGRRYYDTEVGRWITPDPIGLEGGANVYAYVFNNPLSYFDLYGLSALQTNRLSFQSVRNFFGTLKEYVGSFVKLVGDHVLPVPYVRRVVSVLGNTLSGGSPQECRSNGLSHNGVFGHYELDPKIRVMTINGILNNRSESDAMARLVSGHLGGARVHYCYNSSHGLVLDVFECLAQKLGIPTHSVAKAVEAIQEQIKEVGGVGSGGKVYIFAHSQGGLIAKCAFEKLSAEEKQMVHINTFGSASLHNDRELGYSKNYVNTTDCVTCFDPFRYLKGRFSNNTNVQFLKSNKLFDHSFDCHNYQFALKIECDKIFSEQEKN